MKLLRPRQHHQPRSTGKPFHVRAARCLWLWHCGKLAYVTTKNVNTVSAVRLAMETVMLLRRRRRGVLGSGIEGIGATVRAVARRTQPVGPAGTDSCQRRSCCYLSGPYSAGRTPSNTMVVIQAKGRFCLSGGV